MFRIRGSRKLLILLPLAFFAFLLASLPTLYTSSHRGIPLSGSDASLLHDKAPSPRPPLQLDDSLPSTHYRQFPIPPSPPTASFTPVPILPQPCLSSWLTSGSLSDPSCPRALPPRQIDVVWTWLNGSDPLWIAHKRKYSTVMEIGRVQSVPSRHYQDHGELRHSLRAAHEALPDIAKSWVVLGDWGDSTRIGQRPYWLRETADVQTVFHSEIWGGFAEERGWEERLKTLGESLPTFNSFSIEAHLQNIGDIAPQFVYLNDDFFLLAPHTSADFHTPFSLYGPVIPFVFSEPNFWKALNGPKVPPMRNGRIRLPSGFVGVSAQQALSCNHEWEALSRSNYIIGSRFAHRMRPILMHIPKPLLTPIMHEVAVIWGKEAFTRSTKRRFREDGRRRPGDYHMVFLAETLLVERAREAMLWSWAVVKMGQEGEEKGKWSSRERSYLRQLFQIREVEENLRRIQDTQPWTLWTTIFGRPEVRARTVTIPRITLENRHTLSASHIRSSLASLGAEMPKQNTYGWTSLDGVAPPLGASVQPCMIDLDDCFGPWWKSAWMHTEVKADIVFRRIAFEKPQCGDCILSSLILASGPLGMSQILPNSSILYTETAVNTGDSGSADKEMTSQPHLPLTMKWEKTDFSLEAVLRHGDWGSRLNLRDWCEKLIARYTWTGIVNSTSHFAMVGSEGPLNDTIRKLEAIPPPSSVALNDDFTRDVYNTSSEIKRESDRTARRLESWLANRWSTIPEWEQIEPS